MIQDLALLKGVLEDIKQRDEQRGSSSTVKLALARCTTLMDELTRLVLPDQKASTSFRRKRASFKFVGKYDKIRQHKAKIEEAKSILLVALLTSESSVQRLMFLIYCTIAPLSAVPWLLIMDIAAVLPGFYFRNGESADEIQSSISESSGIRATFIQYHADTSA